jgi:hypothetical protein
MCRSLIGTTRNFHHRLDTRYKILDPQSSRVSSSSPTSRPLFGNAPRLAAPGCHLHLKLYCARTSSDCITYSTYRTGAPNLSLCAVCERRCRSHVMQTPVSLLQPLGEFNVCWNWEEFFLLIIFIVWLSPSTNRSTPWVNVSMTFFDFERLIRHSTFAPLFWLLKPKNLLAKQCKFLTGCMK